jgi:hypothetical protein
MHTQKVLSKKLGKGLRHPNTLNYLVRSGTQARGLPGNEGRGVRLVMNDSGNETGVK